MKKFSQTHPPIAKAIRVITLYLHNMFQPCPGSSSDALLKPYPTVEPHYQDCQIFRYTQTGQKYQLSTKLPNGQKYTQNGRNIFQMALKYRYKHFHFMALQNLQELGLLV
jgi:hypothetical protein